MLDEMQTAKSVSHEDISDSSFHQVNAALIPRGFGMGVVVKDFGALRQRQERREGVAIAKRAGVTGQDSNVRGIDSAHFISYFDR
jgi:hypothetical protein